MLQDAIVLVPLVEAYKSISIARGIAHPLLLRKRWLSTLEHPCVPLHIASVLPFEESLLNVSSLLLFELMASFA